MPRGNTRDLKSSDSIKKQPISGKVEKKTAKDRQTTTPQKGIDRIQQQANGGRKKKYVENL
jgi:hypothetical protein